jgi:3-hydroxyisobutyrate dehydrogenase-like beta-hydroxyacid dehydrogenase
MALMLDSAEQLHVPLPLTSLSRQMFQAAIAKVMEKTISAARFASWKSLLRLKW